MNRMPNINLVKANVRVEGSMQDAATMAVDRLSWLAVDLSEQLLEIEANPIILTSLYD